MLTAEVGVKIAPLNAGRVLKFYMAVDLWKTCNIFEAEYKTKFIFQNLHFLFDGETVGARHKQFCKGQLLCTYHSFKC